MAYALNGVYIFRDARIEPGYAIEQIPFRCADQETCSSSRACRYVNREADDISTRQPETGAMEWYLTA